MKHLLDISQLSVTNVNQLIQRAVFFKQHRDYPTYPHCPVVNLFYENSTRTRASFELAAKNLGMPVINLDLHRSSESKGETIEDTFMTLAAMGIKFFIIRHSQNQLPKKLATRCEGIHVINAGDGQHAHPSQALLDVMTIMEHKPDLKSLKIAIVGNLRHSRVANSLQCIFATMGVKTLMLVAPSLWLPETTHYGQTTTSLEEGLQDADVVIGLRVQQERLTAAEHLDLTGYRRDYAITTSRLLLAKPDAIVMHPGPVNRDVEMDSEVIDGPQSVILQQVANGVYMRMAILDALVDKSTDPVTACPKN